MSNKQRLWMFAGLFVLLATTGVLAWFLWQRSTTETSAAAVTERKILYWHDPMYPGTHFDKPGKSPFMDMELVPVFADGAEGAGGTPVVTVRPEILNNLGVRTYTVTRVSPDRQVDAHGYLLRTEGGTLVAQVEVFDRNTDWIRAGLPAALRLTDRPGQVFPARVESVDADVDNGPRRVRIALRRQDPALQPGMSAQATLRVPGSPALAIPREAVIRTASRTAVVLALGAGRFRPVDVVVGPERGEWLEIRRGIAQGDVVVVSGQFLIDSESSLRASLRRMESPAADAGASPPAQAPGARQ